MKRLKFTEEQEQRRKEVHESILDSCKVITQDDNIKIRDYYLEDMAEFMSEVIADVGYKAHYPAIVYLGDDEKAIKEYIEKGDTTNMGKKIDERDTYRYYWHPEKYYSPTGKEYKEEK